MKKLLFILFTFLMAHCIYSQGNNLQFSQAILVENGTTVTVPPGKVWKVVSAQLGQDDGSRKQIIINGNATYAGQNDPGFFPIWLPAGTTINGSTRCEYISVVEFNIVN